LVVVVVVAVVVVVLVLLLSRHTVTRGRGGFCTVGSSAVTGPGLLRSARGDDLICQRAKASAGLRSAADDGEVDVCVVVSQSL
jgi:preprotein translocase subunit SecG